MLTSAQEGQENVVDLPSEDAELVDDLLQALYGRPYVVASVHEDEDEEMNEDDELGGSYAHGHGLVYSLAHRLDVPTVAGLSMIQYRRWFKAGELITNWLPELVKTAYEDLPKEDRALKDPLIDYVRQNLHEIKQDEERGKQLRDAIAMNADFAWELLK